MLELKKYIEDVFGVTPQIYLESLKLSPGSSGAVSGAISEILLKEHLEEKGFEVHRIKEKPAGSYYAKDNEIRGDFYIRKNNTKEWYVVECKGLKTNAEFRGGRLCSKKQVFNYLNKIAFPSPNDKQNTYNKGYNTYKRAKKEFEEKNPDIEYPKFKWNKDKPGPNNTNLDGLWESKEELRKWIDLHDDSLFTEESYRNGTSVIKELQTHMPSSRTSPKGIKSTAPLVGEFSILAVDLFFRTNKHEFVFMNPYDVNHSPSSPEHLYQNYTIDTLVKGKKERPLIEPPWYTDIDLLIEETNPVPRTFKKSQIDNR